MEVAGVIGEVIVAHTKGVGRRRRIVVIAVVVDRVIPSSTAQACADILVTNVQFREQIEPAGDQAGTEIAITIVHIGVGHRSAGAAGDAALATLEAKGIAVFEGIVPAGGEFRDARVELEGDGIDRGAQGDGGADGTCDTGEALRAARAAVRHFHGNLFCFYCCYRWSMHRAGHELSGLLANGLLFVHSDRNEGVGRGSANFTSIEKRQASLCDLHVALGLHTTDGNTAYYLAFEKCWQPTPHRNHPSQRESPDASGRNHVFEEACGPASDGRATSFLDSDLCRGFGGARQTTQSQQMPSVIDHRDGDRPAVTKRFFLRGGQHAVHFAQLKFWFHTHVSGPQMQVAGGFHTTLFYALFFVLCP
ncbi:hypothetical protein D3C71_1244480 [compost metagenome]